jgi:hypothetical protein
LYSQVFPEDRRGKAGIARTEIPNDVWYPLLDHIFDGGEIEEWKELEYSLSGGPYVDFQPETSGLRLCSDHLRRVLDEAASDADVLQWLPASVSDGAEQRRYWILHFPKRPDVISHAGSDVRNGRVVRGAIDPEKARSHSIFPTPDGSTVSFVVNAAVEDAIKAIGCSGLIFEPYPVTG